MKNYSEEIITQIQNSIDANAASIKFLKPDEIPTRIYINGSTIILTNNNGIKDYYIHYEEGFKSADLIEWKREAPGKFYGRDWKTLNKREWEENLYAEVTFTAVPEVNVVALLRRVDMIEDKEQLEYYSEIKIGEYFYAIIKTYSPSIHEYYFTASTLEEVNFVKFSEICDSYGSSVNDNDEDPEYVSIAGVDMADQGMESEELF